jgi:hypothetical protein
MRGRVDSFVHSRDDFDGYWLMSLWLLITRTDLSRDFANLKLSAIRPIWIVLQSVRWLDFLQQKFDEVQCHRIHNNKDKSL